MRVYISGPISGTTDYKARFMAAADLIEQRGYTPLNPVEIVNLPPDSSWTDYMAIDLKVLDLADAIYMLKDWRKSDGAGIELEYALEHKKLIMFEGGVLPNVKG